jgi:adenosylhomocysteine nucleosidase
LVATALPLILMALPEEAQILRRALAARVPAPAELRVFGAGPLNAARALEGVRERPVIHAGFAGGLRPRTKVGELFLIRRARDVHGEIDIAREAVSAEFASRGARPADIRSVAAPLDAVMKSRLAVEGHSDLVDMETATVARAAAAQGCPYTGLRIVSDGLADEIPLCVLRSWDGERFRIGKILTGLLREPQSLPDLIALQGRARRLAQELSDRILECL